LVVDMTGVVVGAFPELVVVEAFLESVVVPGVNIVPIIVTLNIPTPVATAYTVPSLDFEVLVQKEVLVVQQGPLFFF